MGKKNTSPRKTEPSNILFISQSWRKKCFKCPHLYFKVLWRAGGRGEADALGELLLQEIEDLVHSICFVLALLQYNLHAIYNLPECVTLWSFTKSQSCATKTAVNCRIFSSPQKKPQSSHPIPAHLSPGQSLLYFLYRLPNPGIFYKWHYLLNILWLVASFVWHNVFKAYSCCGTSLLFIIW